MGSRPNRIRAFVLIAIAALLLPGCGDNGRTTNSGGTHFVDVSDGRAITAGTTGRDPVTERRQPRTDPVEPVTPSATPPRNQTPPRVADSLNNQAPARDTAPPPRFNDRSNAAMTPSGPKRVWAIVLDTVTDRDVEFEATANDHATLARQRLSLYMQAAPILRGAWIHSDEEGSSILVGQFTGIDDPAAQSQLKTVKTIQVQGRYPFARSILAPIELGSRTAEAYHPYDLRRLREIHPDVNPMYTIDVAAWMTERESDSEWEDCKRRAEAYASQLRASGYQAYFYHNDTQRVSSVTVGAFNRAILDPQSGLYGPEVRRLIEQFPARLMNGEELLMAQRGSDEMRPQQPHVVEVPLNLN